MKRELLYLQIANTIEHQIRNDVLKVGDKLPSLRSVSIDEGVSLNTAQQSYFELEKRGLIESRPQSGYYVSFSYKRMLAVPTTSSPTLVHGMEDIEDIISIVAENRRKNKNLLFSGGTPELGLLPIAKLNKAMIQAMRSLPDSGVNYDHLGNENLKRQVAKRSTTWGGKLKPHDIITTAGSIDAIGLCLMSLVKSGDNIAVESPIYFGILQLAKSLGLNVIELPTNADTGIDPDALRKAIQLKKIKLCILVSNFSNPLGSCMPDEHKKEVVKIMQHYDLPLVEDDIYGDLCYSNQRPKNCKAFDDSGNVLLCNSFSKTLAPGYRVGWVAPGKYKERVERTKLYHSVAINSLSQQAIAHFLENERYDMHLRKLRQALHTNMLQYTRAITEYFPADTKVSRPKGSFTIWVELNKKANSLALYDRAIQSKISIGPGRMYTLQKQFDNCFRLNYGTRWNEKTEHAIKLLGKAAHDLVK